MAVIRAFTLDQAARVSKVSKRRIAYWAAKGVLVPSLLYDRQSRPHRYLYAFEDVVGLRVLGILRDRHRLSLQHLRKANEYLREHSSQPWSELRFWVQGRELLFQVPKTDTILSTKHRHQAVFPIEVEPVAIAVTEDAKALAGRTPEDIGKTERHRNIQGNRVVVKGTRVPVESIESLHNDGYEDAAIVRAYPSLTLADVKAVLVNRRRTAAA